MTREFKVPITLPGDPTDDLHAATKKYVDDNSGSVDDSGNVLGGDAGHIMAVAVGNSHATNEGVSVGYDAGQGGSRTTGPEAVLLGAWTSSDEGGTALGTGAISGGWSIAVGGMSTASGEVAVAVGYGAKADYNSSVALGRGAEASEANEGVLGGDGSGDTNQWRVPGSFTVEGDFAALEGVVLKSPNDTLWRITVDDDGVLKTESIP